jgi:hypothetical protein
MKRRDFITSMGFVSAITLMPFQRAFSHNLNRKSKFGFWWELVDYARWCPSPHNVQPWKMKVISDEEAHLYYDPARIPIIVDGTSAFTIAGMGMFIECLNIAANKHGYKIASEHAPEKFLDSTSEELKIFAKLYLIKTDKNIDINRELIKKRKTSRLQYDGRIISFDIVNALKNITKKYGHDFIFSTDNELIRFAIDLNSKSVLERSQEEPARKEMCKWIRTTDEEAERMRDGWWYRCTGISGKMLSNFFFHHERFESRWKTKTANRILNRSMSGTSNLAWIAGPFQSRNDWVNAGTMLQRLWLEMTKYNVYMHPFGPVITTPASHEKFRKKINFSENENELWFLIRLGYSTDPPRSFRLETKDIIIS